MLSPIKSAPSNPGVYIMRNSEGKIIYVGKAKNIKKRVASYSPSKMHESKTAQLVLEAENIEYIITDNEVEALILEARMIKENQPKFNIDLKDSSSYPYIRITLEEDYPKIVITREKKSNRSVYLGPYTNVKSARRAVKLAVEIFGIRICRMMPSHRCLKHDTKLCSAPCIGQITKEEYRKNVEKAISFLRGNVADVTAELGEKMQAASAAQNYEAAKIYRDEINSIETLGIRQKIESERNYDEDVVGFIRENESYHIQIFNIRRGILLGRTKHEAKSMDEPKKFLADFMKLHYFEAPVPEKITVQEEAEGMKLIAEYLKKISGKKVELSVPRIGAKKKLVKMLLKNISHDMDQKYDAVLLELRDALGLKNVPVVIEFFDVSTIMGKWLVGAMVQFRNGERNLANYRRFRILSVPGQNDFASMHEIVWRRYSRLVRENKPLPDLVVVDGGRPQLSAAISAMKEAGVDIPLAALAKREEEIYLPEKSETLLLDKKSPSLKIMQKMRDEAHRFVIGYHKLLRRKSIPD